MDLEGALRLETAFPFVALLIALVKSIVTIPKKMIPLVALILTVLWGFALVVSDRFDGDLATFILTVALVTFAAAGIQSNFRTYVLQALKFNWGGNAVNGRGGDSGD